MCKGPLAASSSGGNLSCWAVSSASSSWFGRGSSAASAGVFSLRTTIVDRSELGRAAALQGKGARAGFGCEIKHAAGLGGARWGQWMVLRWHAGNRLGNYRFSHARTSNSCNTAPPNSSLALAWRQTEPLGSTVWRRHGSVGSHGKVTAATPTPSRPLISQLPRFLTSCQGRGPSNVGSNG